MRKSRVSRPNQPVAWLYLAPALIILVVFRFYPIIKSFLMGFYTDFDYLNDVVYAVGLDNFKALLKDQDFALALKNTSSLVLFATPLSVSISLFFALLLNRIPHLRRFFQGIYFLPFVTSSVAISIVWAWLLNKDFGLVNSFLRFFGIAKVSWLTNPRLTLPILVTLSVWKGLGYRIIIWLAALQGIDRRFYAAAQIDGAGVWQRFRHITLPLLKPTLIFLTTTTMIGTFKTFDEIYVLYGNRPGPLKSGLTIVYYIFTKFYRHWEFAYAAAAAFLLFLIILFFSLIQFLLARQSRRRRRDEKV